MASASPPPLKRRPSGETPPPPRKKRSVSLDKLELPDEISAPALRPSEPVDDDPTAGEWLFKENDTIRGPVPAKVLIDGINSGQLGADAQIAREVGKWRPLGDVPLFKDAVEAALERKRAEEELRVEKARRRRQNIVRFFVVVFFVVVPFVAGAFGGRVLMAKRPWDDTREWAARMPPLIDLPPKPKPVVARVDPTPPPPVDAPADGQNDDQADARDDDRDDGKQGRGSRKDKNKKGKDPKGSTAPDAKKDDKVASADAPAEQSGGPMPATLSEEQVKTGLLKGFNGFKGCIKTEIDKKVELPARITLAFSIANDGRAIEVKLLERQVRSSPLADCIKGVVAGLRWQKFSGERRYVEFPFNIGPKK